MAQDGAYAMGMAKANLKQILAQFYPGTTFGKATGNVRVPVFSGDRVELGFPEGGEIRNSTTAIKLTPGQTALLYRDGEGTRVKVLTAAPSPTSTTSTSTTSSTTSTSLPPATTTTTGLLPVPDGEKKNRQSTRPTLLAPTSTSTTSTTAPPPAAPALSGTITATPTGAGRVSLNPRNRRYRGVMEATPVAGGLRLVNQVNVETYLRGMGEVRNPKWPAASLQAQAVAARTYAMRAMSVGGELCDSQRCQVYIGSDAEYAQMDAAVSATAGQVLMFGKSLASAVYSANAGGFTADRTEGFGLAGPDNFPYLRPAPYLTENRDEWTVTLALKDIATRLKYRGELTLVTVTTRGPSGRATLITLGGTAGDQTVKGLDFDAALGLRSTLFDVKGVLAEKVATLKGVSVLQAPPEEASVLAEPALPPTAGPARAVQIQSAAQSADDGDNVGFASLVAAALWGAVVVNTLRWRYKARRSIHDLLS